MSGAEPALARARVLGVHRLAERLVRAVVPALGPEAKVLPLKGTLLARTHYEALAERPMGDCDLAVAGVSRGEALRRLLRGGFRVLRVEADPHTTVLWCDAVPNIQLDLHTRPLPVGYGAVDSAWLAQGARRDEALFGAPVWVARDERLLVHLLGNVLRDHVARAHAKCAEDVARVVERSASAPEAFADVLIEARLSRGGWGALAWSTAVRASPAVDRVRWALEARLSRWELRYAAWRLERLLAWSATAGEFTLDPRARALARAVSDAPRDALAGLLVGSYGLLRKRWHAEHNARASAGSGAGAGGLEGS